VAGQPSTTNVWSTVGEQHIRNSDAGVPRKNDSFSAGWLSKCLCTVNWSLLIKLCRTQLSTLDFPLTGQFSGLARVHKGKNYDNCWNNFHRLDAPPVTQPTSAKHCVVNPNTVWHLCMWGEILHRNTTVSVPASTAQQCYSTSCLKVQSVDLLEVLLESLARSLLVRAGWLHVEWASSRTKSRLGLPLSRLLNTSSHYTNITSDSSLLLFTASSTITSSTTTTTPCLKKNCANLFFVITLPNFDGL